ncbi:MAG: N-acetylglucosamine-6-phosphate deacetylase [Lachnospiraceae bacterium]
MKIINGLVFHENEGFKEETLYVEHGRFSDHTTDSKVIDASGAYVIPGLIDIHFHGCVGHDFCDASLEGLTSMAEYELSQGVTSICPASMTLSKDALLEICKNGAAYAAMDSAANRSRLVGINLEGPFISYEKKGAQNPEYIVSTDYNALQEWQNASGDLVKLITIAPETEGAMDFIQKVKSSHLKDISISLGHTTSDYDTAQQAFELGADHVTHLFNAMPSFTHRAPGVIGAAFDAKHCYAEMICDGVHIHPSAIRSAFTLFTGKRIVLISDSMMATGLSDGMYALGGQDVTVKGSHATLADGTLAGSVTNLPNCMRTAVSMGIPLTDAVACTTINPARSIGIDSDFGSLEFGKVADFVLLNSDLTLREVHKA